jgi:hypothetical protein
MKHDEQAKVLKQKIREYHAAVHPELAEGQAGSVVTQILG